MSRNAKPRKKYVPKHENIPMTSARNDIALDLHLAVEAVIAEPGIPTFDQLGAMLATIALGVAHKHTVKIEQRTDADGVSVTRMLRALHSVQERFDRIGRYGLNDHEKNELREASCGMDEAISRIPLNVFRAAVWQVTQQCRGLAHDDIAA